MMAKRETPCYFASAPCTRMLLSSILLVVVVIPCRSFSTIPSLCTTTTLHPRRLALPLLSASTPKKTIATTGTRKKQRRSKTQNNSLLQWAQEKAGIQITNQIQLRHDDTNGFGWYAATSDIPPNSLLMTVPETQVIAVDRPRKSKKNDSDPTVLPWYALLSVQLHEFRMQQTLDYQPWLDALPHQLDTPFHWSSTTLEQLQYAPMVSAVAKQHQQWREYYDRLLDNNNLSWPDFVWGCEMARSRAFSSTAASSGFSPNLYAFTLLLVTVYVGAGLGTLEQAANGAGVVMAASILKDFVIPKLFPVERYVICPMIDMTNHENRNAVQAKVAYEYFGRAYSLATTSAMSIPANSEITISYGDRSNDQLLQYYGFVQKNNPHDVYVLPSLGEWKLKDVPTGRLSALAALGLLTVPVVVTRTTGMDPVVLRSLRVVRATPEEWESKAQQAVTAIDECVSATTEQKVRQVARQVLQDELDAKPTTIAQDEQLLATKSKTLETQDRLAIAFRIEKKRILEEAIEKLR